METTREILRLAAEVGCSVVLNAAPARDALRKADLEHVTVLVGASMSFGVERVEEWADLFMCVCFLSLGAAVNEVEAEALVGILGLSSAAEQQQQQPGAALRAGLALSRALQETIVVRRHQRRRLRRLLSLSLGFSVLCLLLVCRAVCFHRQGRRRALLRRTSDALQQPRRRGRGHRRRRRCVPGRVRASDANRTAVCGLSPPRLRGRLVGLRGHRSAGGIAIGVGD